MSEEMEAIADEMDEEIVDEPASGEAGGRKSHGPGLRLGILVGLIAGAVVATLFAPPTGEETPEDQAAERLGDGKAFSPPDLDADTPMARVRSLVEQVRARVREASREAEIARRETEELAHARYAELTHQEGKKT